MISVHIWYLDDFSTQPSYHNRLESLNSFSVSLLGEQHVKNIARPVRVYRVRDPAVSVVHRSPARPQPLPLPGKPSQDSPTEEVTFAFGSFRLIPAQRMLLEDGRPLRLGSRALDILVTLVESAGEILSKDQLIARTWPDTVAPTAAADGG